MPSRVVHSTTVAAIATIVRLRHNIQQMNDGNDGQNGQDNETPPSSLAEVLTRLRLEAGLTMYQLAHRSGVSRGQLSRMESGEARHPAPATLQRLARALDVEPEEFYDAAWQDNGGPLPSPAVYFRSKYRLSDDQIAELEASVKQITDRSNRSITKRKKSH